VTDGQVTRDPVPGEMAGIHEKQDEEGEREEEKVKKKRGKEEQERRRKVSQKKPNFLIDTVFAEFFGHAGP
jgi:hypothetical protein